MRTPKSDEALIFMMALFDNLDHSVSGQNPGYSAFRTMMTVASMADSSSLSFASNNKTA
jgi:hypothetical protein